MDLRAVSFEARRMISGLWLMFSIALSIYLLHAITDFDLFSAAWWRWVIEYMVATKTPPTPFVYFPVTGVVAGLLVPPLVGFLVNKRAAYGDARKATEKDIRKMGLRAKTGVVLGEFNGKLVRADQSRHTLVVAGTRSGKTQAIVIPTIYNFNGSMVVMDVKGELWDKTAAYRSEISDCYRLEWTSQHTARYNPLADRVLPDNMIEVEQRINNLATVLGPPADPGDHFGTSATNLLRMIMLYEVADARYEKREAEILNVVNWFGGVIEFGGEDEDVSPLTAMLTDYHGKAKARAILNRWSTP